MTENFRFIFVIWILVFSMGVFLTTCASPHKQTNAEIVSVSTPLPTPQSVDLSEIKWMYIGEPLDIKPDESFGASKISIFYKNGDFGRMYVGLDEGKVVDKLELRAYFDEVVQYGEWREGKGKIFVTIQKCRCDHCLEDQPSDKSLKDPLPQTETWRYEKEQPGNIGSVLVRSEKKVRLIGASDFIFMNYDEMVTEPLKVRNHNEDRFCTALDLKNFEKY